MKYITFLRDGAPRVGVVTDAGLVDATALGFPATLNGLIAGGAEMAARLRERLAAGEGETVEMTGLRYSNVVETPSKIVCVGLNYKSHAEETGGAVPAQPVLFSKFSDTLHPAGEPVELPPWQRCYDYEAELVVILGRDCYHADRAEAAASIFGYTVGNDLSARDCQFLSNQWLTGKSFPHFAPAGPVVVTADSFDPSRPHAVRTELNGQPAQDGSTDDMIFSCAEIVEAASRYFALRAGDLIFTGTPAGVILGHPKGQRRWMRPGDTVTVSIEGIGALTTPLV